MREQHCGRPSHVYNTYRPTKLTALETISRWLILKSEKNSSLSHPLGHFRGNLHTPSMARWKARGRLYIRRNWTFFAISYGWDVMSGNRSKSAFFEGRVGHFERRFQREGGIAHQVRTNHCWCQKSRVIAVSCGIKIFAVRCLVFSQYTHLTHRQTDGQNCDSNTLRCITCSRTVKTRIHVFALQQLF